MFLKYRLLYVFRVSFCTVSTSLLKHPQTQIFLYIVFDGETAGFAPFGVIVAVGNAPSGDNSYDIISPYS